MSNRMFRRITVVAVVVLVPGVFVVGLVLVAMSSAGDASNDIGKALIGGSATSSAFFAVGWLIDRGAPRRQYLAEIASSVGARLADVRGAAETARFYIALHHSAPTYRDQIGILIRWQGDVREDIELVSRANPRLDAHDEICRALGVLERSLGDLRTECHERYPKLSDIASEHPGDTTKHRDELETFTHLTRLLDIDWRATAYSQWDPAPLAKEVNAAIAAIHGQTR